MSSGDFSVHPKLRFSLSKVQLFRRGGILRQHWIGLSCLSRGWLWTEVKVLLLEQLPSPHGRLAVGCEMRLSGRHPSQATKRWNPALFVWLLQLAEDQSQCGYDLNLVRGLRKGKVSVELTLPPLWDAMYQYYCMISSVSVAPWSCAKVTLLKTPILL